MCHGPTSCTFLAILVDASSPKICLLTNPTSKTLKIRKHTRLGTIHECEAESTYFVTNMKSAMKTLTFATALDKTYTPQDSARHDAIHLATQVPITPSSFDEDSPVKAIGGEFSLSDSLNAVSHGLDTGTIPYLDKVYQIVKDTKDDGIDRPFISERTSSFGIKPPEDAPFIVSEHGVHIFARDQTIARALKKLCDSHDRVWKNDRPIKVPHEDQTKIPLVEGYQNTKLNSRVYPFS